MSDDFSRYDVKPTRHDAPSLAPASPGTGYQGRAQSSGEVIPLVNVWIRLVLVLVSAMAVATFAGRAVAVADEGGEESHSLLTRLDPGDNFVGWVGKAMPIRDLFEVVPAIDIAYAWDAKWGRWLFAAPSVPDRLWSLHRLEPGVAYRVRIGGTRAVFWERPLVPVIGLVELERGVNLVTWLGRDRQSVEAVGRGLGSALSEIRHGEHVYLPNEPDSARDWPLINRGDPIRVTVSRDVHWPQPTFMLPRITFPGGASDAVRQQVREDLHAVLEFYADEYGIQPDFSRYAIFVPKDKEALESDPVGRRALCAACPWDKVSGWVAGGRWVAVKGELWPDSNNAGRYVLTHELFHLAQYHLTNVGLEIPIWFLEGSARFAELTHQVADGRYASLDEALQSAQWSVGLGFNLASAVRGPRGPTLWHYSLGAIALHHLSERAGPRSEIELFQSLQPHSTWPVGHWPNTQPLGEVFADLYGTRLEGFYRQFAEWQEEHGRSGHPTNEQHLRAGLVTGQVVDAQGNGVESASVRLTSHDTQQQWLARTNNDGAFALAIDGNQHYDVDVLVRGKSTGFCEILAVTGVYVDGSLTQHVYVGAGQKVNAEVVLPEDFAFHTISGTLYGPSGEVLAGVPVFARGFSRGVSHSNAWTLTDGSGQFELVAAMKGDYTLGANLGSCEVFLDDGIETTANRNHPRYMTVDRNLDGIIMRVPKGQCVFEFSGIVLNADGDPYPGVSYGTNGSVGQCSTIRPHKSRRDVFTVAADCRRVRRVRSPGRQYEVELGERPSCAW